MHPNYDAMIARAEAFARAGREEEERRQAAYPRCVWCGAPTPATFGNSRAPMCAECYAEIATDARQLRRLHRGE